MFVSAKDMHYTTTDGRKVLDGTAGLWCVNAGHCRPKITEAIASPGRRARLSRRPSRWATRSSSNSPIGWSTSRRPGSNHVFFTNSGSESVDTALKMAIAYHRAKGDGSRFRLIGRERGYHGVNFGGISVGGIVNNRKLFGTLLTGVDHMPHTHLPAKNAFTRGQPEHGAELADELERIVALHDASTIAAVIVEPVAGSTGVLVPPKGYLQKLSGDLRQARHPVDLRRGHHRLRPSRHAVCRRLFRRDARHHGDRQGRHQRRHPDGRGVREERDPRRLHERPRAPHRVLPRLHLFGQSDRLRGRPRHARHLQGRGPADARRRACRALGGRAAFAEGRAACHRHPQHRPGRRRRAGADPRQPDQAGVLGLRQGVRARRAAAHHRRHHRDVAAADRHQGPDRRADRPCPRSAAG